MASIIKQKYTVYDENGKRIGTKQSKYWYIDYRASDGMRKRVKGFKDKGATAQRAAQLEKESELADVGIIDRYKEHRQRQLTEHLEDFRKSLGDATKHARQTYNALTETFKACGFKFWGDISASTFQNYLNKTKKDKGLSDRTFNFYLKAGQHFCSWMIKDQRAPNSPLVHLQLADDGDCKRPRRPLTLEEIRNLLSVTAQEPERCGMKGYERVALYRLAIESGLRANELRSLKVASFNFDDLTVTIGAKSAKNKKTAALPIRTETAAMLKDLSKLKSPDAQMFNVPAKTAKMLKKDLAAAGIDYIDGLGRYADFHSLRHTTGTLLAASGVHPKVAQSLMRHSDINLTMAIYTHTLVGQEAQAIAALPNFSLPSEQAQKAV